MTSGAVKSDGVPLALWVAGGIVALLLDSDSARVGAEYAQPMTAALALGFGVWVYWRHGGHQITAAGLYSLASATFVGFAGLYWWAQARSVPDEVWVATLTGFWTHVGLYLFWRNPPEYRAVSAVSSEATHWGAWMGLAVSGLGLAVGLRFGGNAVQFFLGGLALLMVALMLHRAQGERITGRLVLAGIVVAAFWQVTFTGYGRLNIVALGLVGLVLASARTSGRRVKAMALAGVVPALWVFVLVREQLGVQLSGTEYDGLGSVVNPLQVFGRLVEAQGSGTVALAHGETFIATLLFWVPSSMWEGKPPGFGAELTSELEPQLLSVGHSMAAHSYGEWFYNWGWLGVVAMVPVVGLLLRWADRLLSKVSRVDSRRSLLWLVVALLVVANVPNLMWAGSFTYLGRLGQEVLILLVLVLPFATAEGARSGRLRLEPDLSRRPPLRS